MCLRRTRDREDSSLHDSGRVSTSSGKEVVSNRDNWPECLTVTGGITVHSAFGLLDGRFTLQELKVRLHTDPSLRRVVHNVATIDCLIIDEISMLSYKMFEQVELVCRTSKQNSYLWGDTACLGRGL